MSALTSPDGIVYPTSTDFIAPLETTLAVMATSMQAAITAQGKYFVPVVSSIAARAAIFPTAVQGNRVYRSDLGYEEGYFGAYSASTNPGGATPAGWYPRSAELGASYRAAPVGGTVLTTNTFNDVAGMRTVANTNGTPVRLEAQLNADNGNSGNDRSFSLVIKCDGVDVPGTSMVFALPMYSGTFSRYSLIVPGLHNPSIGSHVWTVQAKADTANAIILWDGSLIVRPYITR